MKVMHIGISGIVLISLAGCSSMNLDSKQIDYGADATQVSTLEIPPELTSPEIDDRYKVAGASVETYSAYSKKELLSPAERSVVLPEVKGVNMQHNDKQRWLHVEDKPEAVWPVLKSFLHEINLKIQSEDQAAGVLETDWAENRAKIPQGGLRSVIGKVFDGLYSSDQRDKYRIRLERSKAGTDIYLTHYGQEEVLLADGVSTQWRSKPGDPALEAEMLQRLMVRFGGASDNTTVSLAIGNTAVTGSASMLHDGAIVINDAFDKSWLRVGMAIERAKLVIEDKDREKGIYYLGTKKVKKGLLDKMAFWKDDEDGSTHYRVNVKDNGTATQVIVTDQNGAQSHESRLKLEAIYKNIN
jgi:outer membrane protein assembly factor BamC